MNAGNSHSLVNRYAKYLRGIGHAAIDFVYPCQCRTCLRLMQARDGICADCWRDVQFIERPFCEVLGIPFAIDHGDGAVSAAAISLKPGFDRLRAVVIHDGIAKRISQQLKYHDRGDLAPMMAKWMLRASDGMLEESDVIMAVPLHRWRLLSRRFNQSAELARQISKHTDIAFVPAALQRHKSTRQQVGLSAIARQENVRAAFRVAEGFESHVVGKCILLIDDVYTTGATVNSIARVLKRAGAEKVNVLTFAMAIAQPI